MTVAAVHLNLDLHAGKPEFYVAAMFIALTAAVMVVFFILILLELFHAFVQRRNPEHQKYVRLARALLARPDGRARLQRMTPHERGQHWLFAIAFILLVLTGMPIKFADSDWAAGLVSVMGGLTTTRKLHRICGVLLIAMFLYHVGYMLTRLMRQRRQARAAGSRESIWSMLWRSPVVVTPFDVRQFGQLFGYLLFRRRERPAFGEMKLLQKFEYWAVFWACR